MNIFLYSLILPLAIGVDEQLTTTLIWQFCLPFNRIKLNSINKW